MDMIHCVPILNHCDQMCAKVPLMSVVPPDSYGSCGSSDSYGSPDSCGSFESYDSCDSSDSCDSYGCHHSCGSYGCDLLILAVPRIPMVLGPDSLIPVVLLSLIHVHHGSCDSLQFSGSDDSCGYLDSLWLLLF